MVYKFALSVNPGEAKSEQKGIDRRKNLLYKLADKISD
jgi:hypothetical protein